MAEKKEYDSKAFAVANLNAQRANMLIELKEVPDRSVSGKTQKFPVLSIKGSPFHDAHTKDCKILGIKQEWDGATIKSANHSDTSLEGYAWNIDDGLTVTGHESLKILADAGVEFPAADQFMSRAASVKKGKTMTI